MTNRGPADDAERIIRRRQVLRAVWLFLAILIIAWLTGPLWGITVPLIPH